MRSAKIFLYILWQQHYFLILVGTLCEFAMVPGVCILLCPSGRESTLFFLHIQLHNHQEDENPHCDYIIMARSLLNWKATQIIQKNVPVYGACNLTK